MLYLKENIFSVKKKYLTFFGVKNLNLIFIKNYIKIFFYN